MKKTRGLRDGNRNTGRILHVLVQGFLLKGHGNVKGTFWEVMQSFVGEIRGGEKAW